MLVHLDLQNTRHDPYISRRVFVEIVNDFHLPFQLVLGYVQLQKRLTMYVKYELQIFFLESSFTSRLEIIPCNNISTLKILYPRDTFTKALKFQHCQKELKTQENVQ